MDWHRPAVSLVVLLGLLACKKDKSGGAGSPCASDGECNNGFLCESGACIAKEAVEKIRASSTTGASSSGDTCGKAVACCKAVAAKTGSAATANCDGYAKMSDAVCEGILKNWTNAGRAVGVSCEGGGSPTAEAPAQPPGVGATPVAAGCRSGLTRMENGKCFGECLDDSDCPEQQGCTGRMKRADTRASVKVCVPVGASKQGESPGATQPGGKPSCASVCPGGNKDFAGSCDNGKPCPAGMSCVLAGPVEHLCRCTAFLNDTCEY